LQTIRVAYGDINTINYTLTSPTINLYLLSPTPTVEVDVIDMIDGTVRATIPCTVVAPTSGIVSFNMEDATGLRSMNKLLFRITAGQNLQTIPTASEQGLWVY
jgi:hypothetical protein